MPTSSTAARRRRKRDLKNMAIEVSVIVAGVGIALLGEYAITEWNWSKRVDRAEQELRSEAAALTFSAAETVIIAPCLTAQIDKLENHLLDPSKAAEPFALIEAPSSRQIIRKSSRNWPDDAWQASIADGATSRMDEKLRSQSAAYYVAVDRIASYQREADKLVSQLNVIGQSITRTTQFNQNLLILLEQFRNLKSSERLTAIQILDSLNRVGRLPDEKFLDRMLASRISGTITHCQEQELPLNLPQDGWSGWPKELDAAGSGRTVELISPQ